MKDNIGQVHAHSTQDGTEDAHRHDREHQHNHQKTKMVLNRLSRTSGHLESVKRMVKDGRDCSEVLIQLSAVISALKSTGIMILKDHKENCIVDAIQSGNTTAIEDLTKAIDNFIK